MIRNKFFIHLIISISVFFIRTVLTYVFGDILKLNETIVFFSLYFSMVSTSYILNNKFTFKDLSSSYVAFISLNILISTAEFFLFQFLYEFINFQFLRIVIIAPITLIVRFNINKNYVFK